MTCAAARNSAPSDQYRTASDIITTTSDSALWMGWRWKSRFSAPAQCQCAKQDEECQLHRVPSSPSLRRAETVRFRARVQKLSGVY